MRLRVALLAIVVVLLLVLAWRSLGRVVGRTWVWTARVPIAAGQPVQSQDVARVRVLRDTLAPGAYAELPAIQGRRLQTAKRPGDPFYPADFQTTEPKRWLSEQIPAGRVSVSLRAPMSMVPYRDLKTGDRLEVVATRKGGGAFVAAHDAYFLGFIAPPDPAPATASSERIAAVSLANQTASTSKYVQLILAVRPEDVFPLNEAIAAVALVVHGSEEVKKGALLPIQPPLPPRATPVPVPVGRSVEVIAGGRRERVFVR